MIDPEEVKTYDSDGLLEITGLTRSLVDKIESLKSTLRFGSRMFAGLAIVNAGIALSYESLRSEALIATATSTGAALGARAVRNWLSNYHIEHQFNLAVLNTEIDNRIGINPDTDL